MSVLNNLLILPSKVKNPKRLNCAFTVCVKNFFVGTTHSKSGAYDPDGKTVVNILNNEKDAPLMINAYSNYGFRLNNGCFVVGPVALFPNTLLSWNIKDDNDINERSLSLFFHLYPKLDVLIIGLSDGKKQTLISETQAHVHKLMMKFRKNDKINVEVLPTEKAVSTFNFLNVEKRFVGAALIPPTTYTPTIDDEYRRTFIQKKQEGKEMQDEFLLPFSNKK